MATICLSEVVPELFVVAMVAEQGSEYQGMAPLSLLLDTVIVKIEAAYPSKLQLPL